MCKLCRPDVMRVHVPYLRSSSQQGLWLAAAIVKQTDRTARPTERRWCCGFARKEREDLALQMSILVSGVHGREDYSPGDRLRCNFPRRSPPMAEAAALGLFLYLAVK